MPVYEYQCQDCGVRFERRQHITADPIKRCPECGGVVRRLIHPVGVIFKGSGFYVTDNRSKSSTAVPGNSKKPADTPRRPPARAAQKARAAHKARAAQRANNPIDAGMRAWLFQPRPHLRETMGVLRLLVTTTEITRWRG